MVQRNAVDGISRMGRATQGVRVMNLKKGDLVSAVALVVESENGNGNGAAAKAPTLEDEAPGESTVADEAAAAEAAGNGEAKVTKAPRRRSSSSDAPAKSPAKGKAKPASKPKAKPASKKRASSGSRFSGQAEGGEAQGQAAAHRHGEAAGRVRAQEEAARPSGGTAPRSPAFAARRSG